MKNENLIPFLIEEDKTSLPKRGGNYVSEESKSQEELKDKLNQMRKRLSDCNCNCNCNCDCDCIDCNC